MPGLEIIVPVHNEEETIAETLSRLRKEVKYSNRVTIVDDHCDDGSLERLKGPDAAGDNTELVSNENRRGFANALRRGIKNVRGSEDAVVFVMADGCDDPADINRMFELVKNGYDVVCASRFLPGGKREGGAPVKSLFSYFGNRILTVLLPGRFTDWTNSFKIYRKRVIDEISPLSSGFEISLELAVKASEGAYSIKEVPTVWRERDKGVSKFGFKDVRGYLRWVMFALAFRIGLRKT